MAKKAARSSQSQPVPEDPMPQEEDRVSLHLRLDAELHSRLKINCELSGVSLNQFINGILWGAIENLVIGEAKRQPEGYVALRYRPKCFFFGRAGEEYTSEEVQMISDGIEVTRELDKGEFWFGLDFSGRGVVQ